MFPTLLNVVDGLRYSALPGWCRVPVDLFEGILWLLCMPALAACFVSPLSVGLCAVVRRWRPYVLTPVLWWFLTWSQFLISPKYDLGRAQGLERMAANAEPVIYALALYRSEHTLYPDSLTALVPDYLPEIPAPGTLAFTRYEYFAETRHAKARYYELVVRISPPIGFGFDQFVYWPEHMYPKEMYGGWVERIGDWAYVHE